MEGAHQSTLSYILDYAFSKPPLISYGSILFFIVIVSIFGNKGVLAWAVITGLAIAAWIFTFGLLSDILIPMVVFCVIGGAIGIAIRTISKLIKKT
jgi:glucose-6-phosphate-specific signal transduction histidine kinase